MWLTILAKNKGLILIGIGVVFVVGLMTTIKVQASKLKHWKAQATIEATAKESAIKQHDALVDEIRVQQQILREREALRKQQEDQNAKLRQTIKEALMVNRVWADTLIPDGVLRSLQITSLPAPASKFIGAKPNGDIPGKDK